MPQLRSSAQRVQSALADLGLSFCVVEMPDSTRTAAEAARAIGCEVAQIAKSILFRGRNSNKPVLVVASGANRIDQTLVAALAGEPLDRATPEFVRETTGYAIGGVPPVGFLHPIETWIDEDLLRFDQVWAAAGTPFAVFSVAPSLLATLTGGTVASVA